MRLGGVKVFLDEHLLGALIGCLVTLALVFLGLQAGIASALTTAGICWLLHLAPREKRQNIGFVAPAVYGGSFAGMTDLPSFDVDVHFDRPLLVAFVVGLSVITGLTFLVVSRIDKAADAPVGHGFGGRLGTVAALAAVIFVLVVSVAQPAHWSVAWGNLGNIHYDIAALAAELVIALAGAIGTAKILREAFKPEAFHGTRILAASVFALAGLLVLNLFGWTSVVAAFYAACFLGMTTPKVLESHWMLALACMPLVVIVHVVAALLPGMGGGLGLSAFVAAASMVAAASALRISVGERNLADVGAEE